MTYEEAVNQGLVPASHHKELYKFKQFKQIAIIKEGFGFGEIALIEEKGK